ncbi:hypothetical protein BU23DRAFT_557073 [Bimuria novae-zelandiae CBS 107.79]|uniref:Uncharacterized protein n=1 Tax=Bimuria novae-zelandiae CBS 107.79 TaxID=1447943 RepID=A0A6A5UYE2_9PLEO|nr:hypothetical protein BU23DRAFT_557073 [Bimuria novae-zelandiae CBS 107.79]
MSHRLSGLPINLLVAVFILFSILIFTFVLVFVTIVVPGYRLTTSFKVAYNIVITVLATVLSRYASGEIQKQWLRQINHEISDVKYQLHHNPAITEKWRAVLGINTIPERIRSFRSTFVPQLSFLFTGLITAAVVAAVTLTDTTCHSEINPPRIHSGADNKCTRVVPNNRTERSSPLWEYRTFWNNDDGSAYYATTNLGCPSWSGAQYIGSINTVNPNHVAYSRSGVGIQRTAIGTPEIFYTDFPNLIEPSDGPFGRYIDQSNLRTVSQCLPIMAFNPVKCQPGGTVAYKSNVPDKVPDDQANFHQISVEADGCNYTQASAEDPNGAFGVMVSRFCPTNNNVGKGTVAMGATGIISLTLAASMGDKDFIAKHAASYEAMKAGVARNLTYAVSCKVDVRPTIQWRTLTLELRQGNLTTTPSYSKLISGVDGCDSAVTTQANWTLGDGYAGGAAAALIPPLSEGRYWNGMTNTIFNQALNVTDTSDRYSTVDSWQQLIRKKEVAGYGFNDSNNALEDVLGLTAGITMGQMSTLDSMRKSSPLADSVDFRPAAMGKATFACTRVGSGNRSALLFTLPPLLSMLMALYLLFTVPRKPTSFKTSRLDDIIAIGLAGDRELSMAYKADHLDGSQEGLQTSIPRAPSLGNPFEEDIGDDKAMGLQELRAVHRKTWN